VKDSISKNEPAPSTGNQNYWITLSFIKLYEKYSDVSQIKREAEK